DAAVKKLEALETVPAPKLRGALRDLFANDPLLRGSRTQKDLTPAWDGFAKMTREQITDRLKGLREQRRKLLDLKTDLEMKKESLSPVQEEELRRLEFNTDVGELEFALRDYEAQPWLKLEKAELQQRTKSLKFHLVSYSAKQVGAWARNDQRA